MMITIPVATFILFRYLFLVKSNDRMASRVELIIYDKPTLIGIFVWIILSIAIFYFF